MTMLPESPTDIEAGCYLIRLDSVTDKDWLEFVVPLNAEGQLDEDHLAPSLLYASSGGDYPPAFAVPALFRGTWNGYPEIGEVVNIDTAEPDYDATDPKGAERLFCHLVWALDGSWSITDLFTTRRVSVGQSFWFWDGVLRGNQKYQFVVKVCKKL